MDTRVLNYFLAVADTENITAASDILHVTQPTLSRQIHDLEEELGTVLFIRGNRKLTLTREGTLLKKRAQEILSLVEQTKLETCINTSNASEDIRIGTGESRHMSQLMQIGKKFQDENPHACLKLFSGNAEYVTDRLIRGLLDFGVIIGHYNVHHFDCLHLPYKDKWGLLMKCDDPLADKEYITPPDLNGQKLIISSQNFVENEIAGWLGPQPPDFKIAATYNLAFNAVLMAEAGIGSVLCLEGAVNSHDGVCFRPLYPETTVTMDLAWKREQVFSGAASLFLEKVRNNVSAN